MVRAVHGARAGQHALLFSEMIRTQTPRWAAVVVHRGEVVAAGHTAPAGGPHAECRRWRLGGRRALPWMRRLRWWSRWSLVRRMGARRPAPQRFWSRAFGGWVMGALDPNPAHAGRAVPLLEAAGVEVEAGVLAEECADLNLIFNHWIVRGRPFVAAKMATTLDGRVAAISGRSQWITGAKGAGGCGPLAGLFSGHCGRGGDGFWRTTRA